jgi:hypothetical protein
MTINLKPDTRLVGVRSRETGFPERVYDDGEGPVWAFGDEYGVKLFVRAKSFETAYEIAIDESPTIDQKDVPEAFGFCGEDAAEQCAEAHRLAQENGDDYPELEEGYQFQSNFTGTGIVDVGYSTWLREVDRDDLERYRLVIRHYDEELTQVRFEIGSYDYTCIAQGRHGGCANRSATRETVKSYDLCHDVGKHLRRLERDLGAAVDVTVVWREREAESAGDDA